MCPPLWSFIFTKAKLTNKKLELNEYEICLNLLLEMAIFDTQILKHSGGP